MSYTREIEFNGEHLRINWDGRYKVYFETPIGGQWVKYNSFYSYNIFTEQDALVHAYDVLIEELKEEYYNE